MVAYLDASALVKRYVVERGSRETIALVGDSEMVTTSIVTRAEVAAAFATAARTGLVTADRTRSAQRSFSRDWPDLVRMPVTEALVERAEALAWVHGLRGYDAVQLATDLAGVCWDGDSAGDLRPAALAGRSESRLEGLAAQTPILRHNEAGCLRTERTLEL